MKGSVIFSKPPLAASEANATSSTTTLPLRSRAFGSLRGDAKASSGRCDTDLSSTARRRPFTVGGARPLPRSPTRGQCSRGVTEVDGGIPVGMRGLGSKDRFPFLFTGYRAPMKVRTVSTPGPAAKSRPGSPQWHVCDVLYRRGDERQRESHREGVGEEPPLRRGPLRTAYRPSSWSMAKSSSQCSSARALGSVRCRPSRSRTDSSRSSGSRMGG